MMNDVWLFLALWGVIAGGFILAHWWRYDRKGGPDGY
jgi:hypothetical protein